MAREAFFEPRKRFNDDGETVSCKECCSSSTHSQRDYDSWKMKCVKSVCVIIKCFFKNSKGILVAARNLI